MDVLRLTLRQLQIFAAVARILLPHFVAYNTLNLHKLLSYFSKQILLLKYFYHFLISLITYQYLF